jgi:hypothetical protein
MSANNIELLKALPSTSVIEHKLRCSGAVIVAGSETANLLARYDKARTALARSVAAATCKLTGFALAAAAEGDLPADQAAKVARECAAALEALAN